MKTLLLRSRVNSTSGFSLVEIAVVLVIISVLLAIVAVPVATQVEQRRREETSKQLDGVKEALIGFAMSNGRLPCPALLNTGACISGRECFCAEQSGTSGTCTPVLIKPTPYIGRCAAFGTASNSLQVGFLPAATLGVTPTDANGYALDAFNTSANQIYYAVARNTVGGISFPLTADDGIKNATMSKFAGATLLTVCPTSSLTCTSTSSLTSFAPFVVFSRAKNANVAFAALSAKEQANLDNDSGYIFVAGDPVSDFDDILTWTSVNTLFARMVQAGKLP